MNIARGPRGDARRHRDHGRGDARRCVGGRRRAATSPTVTAPRASSGCWPPASPCCSASSSSWRSRPTTSRVRVPRPRRPSWLQQVQTAQFLPDVAAELTGELTCYARSVAGPEWDALRRRNAGRPDQPLGRGDVPHDLHGRPADGDRAVRLRPVDGPDRRSGTGADRPHPRGGGHHPAPAVAGAVRDLRRRSSPTCCSSPTRRRAP